MTLTKNINNISKENNTTKKPFREVGMEERIKSGEEIEVTEAVNIIFMIKDNIPLEEISKKTGRPLSDVVKVKNLLDNQ